MRAVSVHRDALVVTSRMWQTNAIALRAGDEAMLIDSPYFPDELEALPGLLAGAGLPAGRPARHPRGLRPPARPARLPGAGARGGGVDVERLRPEPGEAQRDAARPRRSSTTWSAPRRSGSGRCSPCRCPAASSSGPRSSSCTRPRATPPTASRCSRAAVAAVPGRLPVERRDPDDLAGRLARRLPLHARAAGAARGGGRDGGARPRLAARPRRGAAHPRRGPALPRRAGARRGAPALPKGRDTGEQRDIHARNLRVLG